MEKILRVNSGNVRHAPHDGVVCSTMRLLVLVTENTTEHNGVQLVEVIDAIGEKHWVDPWFLDDIAKWQWMDHNFGPMGWFTHEERAEHNGKPEFSNGHWRPISVEEVESMNAAIGQMAYEQS